MRLDTLARWLCVVLILSSGALTARNLVAGEWHWKELSRWPAPEAVQAAAADAQFLFAIHNTSVAKYDRKTGARVAVSTGEAVHLNSGFFWEGKLYCAHSNYPKQPEASSLLVLDPATMRLAPFKDFGDFGGSLTWAVRLDDTWWCNFAHYGEHNARTFLVQFSPEWKELRRFTYPEAVLKQLGKYSLSGGVWRSRLLYVTGHDDRVMFRLRLPQTGTVLEFVDQQEAPFTGQGIASDPVTWGLVGIDRAKREIVAARLDQSLPEPRLPRDQLLLFRNDKNASVAATSVADWERRRDEVRRNMQIVMGPLPGREKRCPLDVQIEEESDQGTYVRRLITYASEPGSRTPAYLCIPKAALQANAKPVPGVICLHGTDNTVGHGTVVGLGNRPNRQYASELAERGFVTLAPNYPLLAKYQPDLYALGWESGTLKAVWDNMRGLDLLETLPYVKRDATGKTASFGTIGHSLGGHNSVYTAVLDDRLGVVVTSCGLDSYLDYYDAAERVWMPEAGWTQTRYMPRLREYRGRLAEIPFDFYELVAALAPKHVLIVAPLQDSNFRFASVDRIAAAAKPVFKLYGDEKRLVVEHPDCPHDFPTEMREQAYRLFEAVLKK